MTNTELSGGDAVLRVAVLEQQVAALEAEKAGRQQAVPGSEDLLPCPHCGGDVDFHKDEECSGCHYIWCGQCNAFFDFATGADPENKIEHLDGLQSACAGMWNRRAAAPAPAERVEQQAVPSNTALRRAGLFLDRLDSECNEIKTLRRLLSAAPAPAERVEQQAVPSGWVPLLIEYDPGYPEEVAFGPQRMMDRLKLWLDKYFAMRSAAPAAIELSGIGRDAGHPRAVLLYLRHDPSDEDLRTIQEMFRTAYPAPTPATPDVAGLVEALKGLMRLESRDRVMPVGAEWDAARQALATFHSEG